MNHSKENKHLVKIFDLSRNGSGVGRLENGMTVFVPLSCPGDEIWIEITEEKKKYCFGKVLKIHKASERRVTPECKVFGDCGGCDWQHIPYSLQWKTKTEGALQALKRNHLSLPQEILFYPAEETWRYRNRIQLHVQDKKIGFYKKKSKTLIEINDCPITKKDITDQISHLAQGNLTGVEKIEIEMQGKEIRSAINQPHAYHGFRQIHDVQNEKLRLWIKEKLSLDPAQALVELFGGSGNLSELLLPLYSEIHSVDSHISDRLQTRDTVKFYEMKVESWLKKVSGNILSSFSSYDLLLDPPRSGFGPHSLSFFIQALKKHPPKKLIWVGCDPIAWAKEISSMASLGAEVQELSFFDFFPQTTHLESVALLKF